METDLPEPVNLRAARIQAGLSQEGLADALGVAQRTVSNWERGETAPSPERAARLAELLHVDSAAIPIDRRVHFDHPLPSAAVGRVDALAHVVGRVFGGRLRAEKAALANAIARMQVAGSEDTVPGTGLEPSAEAAGPASQDHWITVLSVLTGYEERIAKLEEEVAELRSGRAGEAAGDRPLRQRGRGSSPPG